MSLAIAILAVVCIFIAVIGAAVQIGKIRGGWVHPKFAGRADAFLAAKRKEYTMLAWVGVVMGPAWFVIAALDWGKPEGYVRLIVGAFFVVNGLVMFMLKAKLPAAPVEPRAS